MVSISTLTGWGVSRLLIGLIPLIGRSDGRAIERSNDLLTKAVQTVLVRWTPWNETKTPREAKRHQSSGFAE